MGVHNRNGLIAHAAQMGLTDHLGQTRIAPRPELPCTSFSINATFGHGGE